ncbi:MAG: hypothetical protein NVSMB13_15450 [Mycobacteriales bacterium]
MSDTLREPDATAGALRAHLSRIERLIEREAHAGRDLEQRLLPAWRRVTQGEPRWPVSLAVLAAVALQVVLPDRLAFRPHYLLPALEGLLLVGLVIGNPRRFEKESGLLRTVSLGLIGVISLANAASAGRLIHGLVAGTDGQDAGPLLTNGAAIWLTNLLVFALWYWDLDRGGPVKRANGVHSYPDFQFAQMTSPDMAPPEWEPRFADYLYLSFTNATAFSPTDVLPLSRWAKMTMLVQSAVSLATIALVIARAVNILK